MSPLKICFAGTPEFAAVQLAALLRSNHEVKAVYTQPDRPSGRGKLLKASAVKQLASEHQLTVYQPSSLKSDESLSVFRDLAPDLLIVVAYGLILPQAILDIPKFGCLNVHASLLPRWRGAAPIERAILCGDTKTGVTIMEMDAGLDTGRMLLKASVDITETDNRVDLESKLASAGQEALGQVLSDLPNYLKSAEAQDDDLSSYAAKVDKSEAVIDWHSPAEVINRQVRAFVGRFPAYCFLEQLEQANGGERMRVLECNVVDQYSLEKPSNREEKIGEIVQASKAGIIIRCNNSYLSILTLQFPGKNPMSFRDALNSRRDLFAVGRVLGEGAKE